MDNWIGNEKRKNCQRKKWENAKTRVDYTTTPFPYDYGKSRLALIRDPSILILLSWEILSYTITKFRAFCSSGQITI